MDSRRDLLSNASQSSWKQLYLLYRNVQSLRVITNLRFCSLVPFWWKCFYSLQIYTSEESNCHSGAFVFLLGQLLSSIPFLFLVSISSSLIFYFLVGLRDEFSLLMYFVLNFFMCLLVNEGLILVMASLWRNIFWIVLTLVSAHVRSLIQALPMSPSSSRNEWYICHFRC